MVPRLPPSVHVIVRDWLNANHVLLRGEGANVLIDSAHVSSADQTLALVGASLDDARLDWLVNTHCHSDHMGGNAALQRAHACHTTIPIGEAPLISAWNTTALWLDWAGQRAERFAFDDTISPGDTHRWGGLEWRAIAAPGHDAGALMFYCKDERILISGDALWRHGFGIVLPDPPGQLVAARNTLETIASLEVGVVIPGHGAPFAEVEAALEESFSRLERFAADEDGLVRYVLKVMLAFTLLERGRLPLSTLPDFRRPRADIP
jgi:glyoxylase-like metal-dependent hydrolase (beta-lactamase superfamily II)